MNHSEVHHTLNIHLMGVEHFMFMSASMSLFLYCQKGVVSTAIKFTQLSFVKNPRKVKVFTRKRITASSRILSLDLRNKLHANWRALRLFDVSV